MRKVRTLLLKVLAIALVAVLALSLLTACGSKNNTPSGGGNTNTNTNTNTPSNSSTPSGNIGNNSTTTPLTSSTPSGNEPTPSDDDDDIPFGDNTGEATDYPEEWSNDVPKMSGQVVRSFAMALDPHDGCQVVLENKTIDEIMDYIEILKNNGYTKHDKDVELPFTSGGAYANTLRNGTWAVGITFNDSNKEAAIYFMKDQ